MAIQFQLHESYTSPGIKIASDLRNINEDRIYFSPQLAVLVDGATAVTDIKVHGLSAAAYCAQYVISWMALSEFAHPELNARELLLACNHNFSQHIRSKHPALHELGTSGPSASVVILKCLNDVISFAKVGDSTLLENNGEWREPPIHKKLEEINWDGLLISQVQKLASEKKNTTFRMYGTS